MKRYAVVVAFAVLVIVSGRESGSAQAPARSQAQRNANAAPTFRAKKLTRAELDALLGDPGKVLILDVRRPDELIAIGGFAVFISVQAGDLEKQLGAIPKDRPIVTVSNHANRAGRAADLLAAHGFTVAGAIGAQDYESEGGTLVKIAPRPAGSTSSATR